MQAAERLACRPPKPGHAGRRPGSRRERSKGRFPGSTSVGDERLDQTGHPAVDPATAAPAAASPTHPRGDRAPERALLGGPPRSPGPRRRRRPSATRRGRRRRRARRAVDPRRPCGRAPAAEVRSSRRTAAGIRGRAWRGRRPPSRSRRRSSGASGARGSRAGCARQRDGALASCTQAPQGFGWTIASARPSSARNAATFCRRGWRSSRRRCRGGCRRPRAGDGAAERGRRLHEYHRFRRPHRGRRRARPPPADHHDVGGSPAAACRYAVLTDESTMRVSTAGSVSGGTPWPRLRTWAGAALPRSRTSSTCVSSTGHGADSSAGSTLPCRERRRPDDGCLGERDAPVDAHHVGADVVHGAEQLAAAHAEVHGAARRGRRRATSQRLRGVPLHVRGVVGERQRPTQESNSCAALAPARTCARRNAPVTVGGPIDQRRPRHPGLSA